MRDDQQIPFQEVMAQVLLLKNTVPSSTSHPDPPTPVPIDLVQQCPLFLPEGTRGSQPEWQQKLLQVRFCSSSTRNWLEGEEGSLRQTRLGEGGGSPGLWSISLRGKKEEPVKSDALGSKWEEGQTGVDDVGHSGEPSSPSV